MGLIFIRHSITIKEFMATKQGSRNPVRDHGKYPAVDGRSRTTKDKDAHKHGHENYDKGGLATKNGNADGHNQRRAKHRAEHTEYSQGVHKTISDRRNGIHHPDDPGQSREVIDNDGGPVDNE